MTNINKINLKQKDVLAKNILSNSSQGKATAKRLWEELVLKLNSYGPPTKDVKLWRKAFADQKFNGKKKISFNKASKQKTGGGLCQEMILTPAEEQIVQATGVDMWSDFRLLKLLANQMHLKLITRSSKVLG